MSALDSNSLALFQQFQAFLAMQEVQSAPEAKPEAPTPSPKDLEPESKSEPLLTVDDVLNAGMADLRRWGAQLGVKASSKAKLQAKLIGKLTSGEAKPRGSKPVAAVAKAKPSKPKSDYRERLEEIRELGLKVTRVVKDDAGDFTDLHPEASWGGDLAGLNVERATRKGRIQSCWIGPREASVLLKNLDMLRDLASQLD